MYNKIDLFRSDRSAYILFLLNSIDRRASSILEAWAFEIGIAESLVVELKSRTRPRERGERDGPATPAFDERPSGVVEAGVGVHVAHLYSHELVS